MNISPISSVEEKRLSGAAATDVSQKNSLKEGETEEVTGFFEQLTTLLFRSNGEAETEEPELASSSKSQKAIPTQPINFADPDAVNLNDIELEPLAIQSSNDALPAIFELDTDSLDEADRATTKNESVDVKPVTTAQVMNDGDELLGRLQQANQTLLTTSGNNLPNQSTQEEGAIDFSTVSKTEAEPLDETELPDWKGDAPLDKAVFAHSDMTVTKQPIDESEQFVIPTAEDKSTATTQMQQLTRESELPKKERLPNQEQLSNQEQLVASPDVTASGDEPTVESVETITALAQADGHTRHESAKPNVPHGLVSPSPSAAISSQPSAHPAAATMMMNDVPLTNSSVGSAAAATIAESVQSVPVMDPKVLQASLRGSVMLAKEKQSLDSEPGREHSFAQQLATAAGQSSATQPTGLRHDPAMVQGQPLPLALNKGIVADEMAERVQMMMSKNLKNIDIRLDPPELGRMHIRMNMHGDGASVQFMVANNQARDALEQSMPRLREMLAQQGVQLADTSVQQQSAGQQQQYSANGRESGGLAGKGPLLGDENLESDIKLDLNVATKRDGISYYA